MGGDKEVSRYGEEGEDLAGDVEGELVILDVVEGDGAGMHFQEVFLPTVIESLIQDRRFDVLERPQRDMTRFIGAMIGALRRWMTKAILQRHGI